MALTAVSLGASPRSSGVVSGYIGSHKLTFAARSITDEAEFKVEGDPDYLAITEVYPDSRKPAEYSYTVSAPGTGICFRTHRSTGFGPVTWFVKVKRKPVGTIRLLAASGSPVLISSVWGVTEERLRTLLANDRFTIMGLVPGGKPEARENWMRMLAEKLPRKARYGIGAGFSSEICYANSKPETVRAQLEACLGWARKYDLPAMLGLVSWWSGSPIHEPDGLGGRFGDIKYQQVCYSPDVESEENPELKALLGDRYDRHYGLSVPNQWSSVPWLTMNSDALNSYRYGRLDEAVEVLKQLGKPDWVDSIYLENEPRYWDTACEAGNPKAGRQGKTLWADFNPLVTQAAKKDGVVLDPSDGLADEELAWLHRNVGVYNQGIVDAARKSMAKRDFAGSLPLYTHSLQHRDMFPGGPINHPASEWAYADGARTGIEGMWSHPSDFTRLREWGRWANLNREENDGHHTDEHLWDLRVAYMMGADLYNSYNWHAIGAERFFEYVDEFVRDLPVVTLPPVDLRSKAPRVLEMRSPMKLQAFSRVEVSVEAAAALRGMAWLVVESPLGSFRSEGTSLDLKKGAHALAFDFTTPAEASCHDSATLTLEVSDHKGRPPRPGSIRLIADSPENVKLTLDLRTQRALSLAVISRAKR